MLLVHLGPKASSFCMVLLLGKDVLGQFLTPAADSLDPSPAANYVFFGGTSGVH